MSKAVDALVSVVHSHSHSSVSRKLVNFHLLLRAVVSLEGHFEGSGLLDNEVSGLVLVSEGMSSDDDGLLPARNEPRDVLDDDGLSEDSSVQNVSDGAIGTLPHLFQFELFDSGLIRSDGGTLDAYFALFDGFSCFDGDFVISFISVFHSEVEVKDLQVEEGKDEFVFDGLPDESGHFVSI